MPPNLPSLKPGDLVAGRFRIVEMIGSGGFSVVYRAHQEAMNRFVALKVLKPQASHDAKIVERFRREALYASHLSHPNTITLFDYGTTEDNLCYIAMEHLAGTDLSAVVQLHEPMDLARVWKILVQCARSLTEAHRLGLVHRDLKPENIFLVQREDGEFIKVLDFGVSKAISSFGDAGPATLAPLTQQGTVFGTPLYMAPEQAMAEEITPAVDVYALGHIAFEMITGHAAYEGCTNAMDVMLKQINDPPLALPAPWEGSPFSELITWCTQKDPQQRTPNASAMLDLLMQPKFEPFMDPTERPARAATLPRAPAVHAEPAPALHFEEGELEEVYRWELEALDEALSEARSERDVRAVIIRGRPGTGRSNLLRAWTSKIAADPQNIVLHRVAGGPDEGQRDGLETELANLTGLAVRGSGIDEVKRLLATLYGEDEELARTADDLGTDSRPLATLTSLRDTLLSRIAQPFRERADEGGVLVWALENLERLDTLSLAFLDRFFRDLQAHPAPLLIVATVYPEDLKRRPGLLRYTQGLLQATRPIARQLSLVAPGERKLDDDEAAARARIAQLPDDLPVDGSYVGLPELADSSSIEDEHDETDRITIQDFENTLNDTSEMPLPVETAFDEVLGYLAQLGDEVPVDLWKLVYARVLRTDLVRLVDTIMSQADRFGILHRAPETLRFAKPGFADSLRDDFEALPQARSAHRQLAEQMLQYYNRPNHEQFKRIAQHWRGGGMPGRAVSMLFGAGEAAFQALDLDAAREYYLQIQKVLDEEQSDTELDDDVTSFSRSQIWLRLGEIHGALGEHGAAEDGLKRALQEADPDDREIQGRAHKLLGDLAAGQERYGDALKSFERSRGIFRTLGFARPFVAVTAEMGQCALQQGRAALAEELSRQALEMAQKLKDRALIARVHRHLGCVLARRARFLEAMEHLEQSMQRFETLHREYEVVDCLNELGNVAFASGKYVESREHVTRAIALSSSLHMGSAHASHLALARALAALGNLDQAEAHLAEALARVGTSQEFARMAEVHLYLGDLHLARGQADRARRHFDDVIELARAVGQMRTWLIAMIRLAYVAFAEGDEKMVYEKLGQALEKAQQLQDRETELQIRAHIIYTQLLNHGFRAKGDTFSTLLNASDEANLSKATVLCYLFKADVSAARGQFAEARDLLRYAHVGAAQIGDYALFIPIARRNYLLQSAVGQLGDPHIGAGHAIGALLPPETGARRLTELPTARE